ncbi:MAG: peptidoglycan-binding protein [Candidatus Nomurabacteria bacterium]|nr:MAG: peptidoglycan-binding protein [Candidatus Nomurabacteria bacterium]
MKHKTFKQSMVGGIIALSLVGITFPAPYASAATAAELQAQIQSLLAQIAALQSQLGAKTTPSQSCSIFNRDLTLGVQSDEVTRLQNFLISKGYTIPAGATGYFGGQTQQALVKFQKAEGISPAVGYFGPLTRGRVQNMCTPVVTPPTTTPPAPSNPTTETPTEEILSGEASIERFDVKDGDDTDLEEGDKNAEIMEVSFRVSDGDVRINRFDLGFTPDSGNDENDPWDTFGTLSIYQGTKKIAEVDASKEKNWREDEPMNGSYTLRLSGLNYIVKESKTVELTVKASIQKNVKGTANGEIWNVFVPTNGIRGLDADKAVVYAGNTADAVTLNIDRAGATDELLVRRSNADLNATTLQLKDNNRSGFLPIFSFDLDTDDSKNDIEVRKIPVSITVSTSTLSTFMRDIRLVVGNKTYTDEVTVDGQTGVVTFEFDRDDFIIDAGDRITATVEVDFKALSAEHEGTTIGAAVVADDIVAEGTDDLSLDQLSGTATGDTHTMATKGTAVNTTTIATSAVVTTANGEANDYATFSITVPVTAFGQDVYIPNSGTSVVYKLTDATGNALTASGTAIVTSSADERGNYFFIAEDSTETVTLTVTYVPGATNTVARLQLMGIGYSNDTVTPDTTWTARPENKYRTNVVTIVN